MNDSMFVGVDVHKGTISVAVGDGMGDGPGWRISSVRGDRQVSFCYKADPCGYGLHRQLKGLRHNCMVVAWPLADPERRHRVKTDRSRRRCWPTASERRADGGMGSGCGAWGHARLGDSRAKGTRVRGNI